MILELTSRELLTILRTSKFFEETEIIPTAICENTEKQRETEDGSGEIFRFFEIDIIHHESRS